MASADNGSSSVAPIAITRQSSLSGEQAVAWDNYVRFHPLGTVFHSSSWQRLIESSFGHKPVHLVAKNPASDQILGLVPLFLVRSRIFGRMLISTPQAAYGGIIADSPMVERQLLARACDVASESNTRFLELRNFRSSINDPALKTKDLYVTFRQHLNEDPEKTFMSIPRKTRAEAREGIRKGLEFRVQEIDAHQFYSVYSRNLRDLGTPVFSKQLFENGLKEFGRDCRIFSVHWKGKVVGAVWTLIYKDEILPYYGGSLREFNHLPINNFLYWTLMKFGCENGYRVFDFGRSKKGTGSFDFKKRWGMEMLELPYQYALARTESLPDTSPLNPRFSLAIRMWQKLPIFLANTIGPLVSKHLV